MKIFKLLILAALLIGGAAAIVKGAFMLYPPAGFIALGSALIFGAVVLSELFRDDGHS